MQLDLDREDISLLVTALQNRLEMIDGIPNADTSRYWTVQRAKTRALEIRLTQRILPTG